MNSDDQTPPPPPAPGPLEDAYLHRDVHPDDQPGGTNAHHPASSLLFPEAHSANDEPDDVGMFV
jgi:hypothetical protein